MQNLRPLAYLGDVRFVLPCPPAMQTAPISSESGKKSRQATCLRRSCGWGGWGRRLAGNVLSWCWLRCGRSYRQTAGEWGVRKAGNVVSCRPSAPAVIAGVELGFLLVDPSQVAGRDDHLLPIVQLHEVAAWSALRLSDDDRADLAMMWNDAVLHPSGGVMQLHSLTDSGAGQHGVST